MTKLTVERMLQDYASAYDLTYTSLRYFNASGADPTGSIGEMHDPESHLIPLLLKRTKSDLTEMKIFGDDYDTKDGTCIRDYIHVNDLARAHILALEKSITDNTSTIYNLGNSKGHSVYEVVETVRKVTGHPLPITIAPRRSGDPAVLVADSRKARAELGWQPEHEDLTEIVRTAWNWECKRNA
jgi:UDP-glucose 4-epimerase